MPRIEIDVDGVRAWMFTKPRQDGSEVWYVAVPAPEESQQRYSAIRSLKTTSKKIAREKAFRLLRDGAILASREDVRRFLLDYWTPSVSRRLKARRAAGRGPGDQHCANSKRWIEHHFLPYCEKTGVTRLDQLTYTFLQDWINELSTTGRVKDDAPVIGPATANKVRKAVYQALRQAVREGLLRNNPLNEVEAPGYTEEQKEAARRSHIEWTDLEKILVPIRWSHYGCYCAALLSLCTGARAGELRALQWQHLDLETRSVNIVQSWDEFSESIKSTKSGTKRLGLKVPAYVISRLRVLREKAEFAEDDDFVFPADEGPRGKPIGSARFTYHLRQAAKRAGVILPPNTVFHSLRHSAVSYGIAGAEERARRKALLEIVGHSDESIQGIYAHTTEAQKEALAEEWQARFERIG